MSNNNTQLSMQDERIRNEYLDIALNISTPDNDIIYLAKIMLEKHGLENEYQAIKFWHENLPLDLSYQEVDKAVIESTFKRFCKGEGRLHKEKLIKICKGFYCDFSMCVKIFSAYGYRFTTVNGADDIYWRKTLYEIGKNNEAWWRR